jgi:opacity protein-like surface antigen
MIFRNAENGRHVPLPMKFGLLLCLGASGAFAQFSFGVRGGVPFTNFFQAAPGAGAINSSATRFTLGPTVELRLPAGFGLEADALYRHFHYDASSNLVDQVLHSTASNAWEFPLLAKYRMKGAFVRPFLDAGVAFDHWSGVKQITDLISGVVSKSGTSGSNTGFVAGAGIELHLPLVRLSPEIRYTRWGAASITDLGGALKSNQNQLEFLVGLTF